MRVWDDLRGILGNPLASASDIYARGLVIFDSLIREKSFAHSRLEANDVSPRELRGQGPISVDYRTEQVHIVCTSSENLLTPFGVGSILERRN
jgi:hypothetical protein